MPFWTRRQSEFLEEKPSNSTRKVPFQPASVVTNPIECQYHRKRVGYGIKGSLTGDEIKMPRHRFISMCMYVQCLDIHNYISEKRKWGLAGLKIRSEITLEFERKAETQTMTWLCQNHRQELPGKVLLASSDLKWLDHKYSDLAIFGSPEGMRKKRIKMVYITEIHPPVFKNESDYLFLMQSC